MRGDTYIVLGSGQAGGKGASPKAARLDKVARAGIRVPKGILMLDVAWDQAMLAGLMEVEDEQRVRIPDAARFLHYFQLPKFNKPLAVRSAFGREDGDQRSLAGYFKTVLHVDPDDPRALADAIVEVLGSAADRGGEIRRDVLIMEMVDAQVAGVAFTEHSYEDDLVNYTEGLADDLLSGEVDGESLSLPRLRNWEKRPIGSDLAPWMKRLQNLLREVRRWIGPRDWDVEWADDGEYCYLVQLRAVTYPTRRNEAFTIANHKEVLPELPSTFMTSLIESCAGDLFWYYGQFDSSLPEDRPFIEVFHGRPYINLSLITEMMRIFGLPTGLVTDNIGGQIDQVYGWNFSRLWRKTLKLILPRLAWAQFRAVQSVEERTAIIAQRIENPGATIGELVDTLRWLYITLVHEMFSLTAAIAPMLSLLRRFGTLEEHGARQQTIPTRMHDDLEPLRQYVAANAHLLPSLERGEIPDDEGFCALWTDYIARYGHRGIYESDISRPRYHERPEPVIISLTRRSARRMLDPPRTFRGRLTWPLWWQAGRTMRARERWRHNVMVGFDRVRQGLLRRAAELVENEVLPDVESLWLLTIDESRKLETGWLPDTAFFRQRQQEIKHLASYHLPDLLYRFDDLEQYRDIEVSSDGTDYVTGISLTTGVAEGRAWVLREPRTMLPEGFDPDETILVARAVDAGWIPTFSRVAGVVVETGGDLSHGSIILRELGLPAITNTHDATRVFNTGEAIVLDAGNGLAHKADETFDG